MQVAEVFDEGGLSHIRDMVCSHHLGKVFSALHFTIRAFAHRCGGGICKARRCRRTLDTGIHVCAVVVTYIYHIMATFHSAGQRLEPDIIGAAVTAESNKFIVAFYFTFFLQHTIGRFSTADGGASIFKSVMDEGILPSSIRIHERGNFQAAGGGANHSFILIMKTPQHVTNGNGAAAASTHSMAACQTFFFTHGVFQIGIHRIHLS